MRSAFQQGGMYRHGSVSRKTDYFDIHVERIIAWQVAKPAASGRTHASKASQNVKTRGMAGRKKGSETSPTEGSRLLPLAEDAVLLERQLSGDESI